MRHGPYLTKKAAEIDAAALRRKPPRRKASGGPEAQKIADNFEHFASGLMDFVR